MSDSRGPQSEKLVLQSVAANAAERSRSFGLSYGVSRVGSASPTAMRIIDNTNHHPTQITMRIKTLSVRQSARFLYDYLQARAALEEVSFSLTPSYFEGLLNGGVRQVFGVVLDERLYPVEDVHEPRPEFLEDRLAVLLG